MLGLGLVANGLTMLVVPANWYAMVPGVIDTGASNPQEARHGRCTPASLALSA